MWTAAGTSGIRISNHWATAFLKFTRSLARHDVAFLLCISLYSGWASSKNIPFSCVLSTPMHVFTFYHLCSRPQVVAHAHWISHIYNRISAQYTTSSTLYIFTFCSTLQWNIIILPVPREQTSLSTLTSTGQGHHRSVKLEVLARLELPSLTLPKRLFST